MPKLSFSTADGTQHVVDGTVGESVMQAAVRNGITDIIAECGGAATCGTCHVWVDADSISSPDVLPAVLPREDEVLDGGLTERRPTSRLACQLPVTDELAGMHVEVPEPLW